VLPFLADTHFLEAKLELSSTKKFLEREKERMDEERQMLLNFAAELSKEVPSVFLESSFCMLCFCLIRVRLKYHGLPWFCKVEKEQE